MQFDRQNFINLIKISNCSNFRRGFSTTRHITSLTRWVSSFLYNYYQILNNCSSVLCLPNLIVSQMNNRLATQPSTSVDSLHSQFSQTNNSQTSNINQQSIINPATGKSNDAAIFHTNTDHWQISNDNLIWIVQSTDDIVILLYPCKGIC